MMTLEIMVTVTEKLHTLTELKLKIQDGLVLQIISGWQRLSQSRTTDFALPQNTMISLIFFRQKQFLVRKLFASVNQQMLLHTFLLEQKNGKQLEIMKERASKAFWIASIGAGSSS